VQRDTPSRLTTLALAAIWTRRRLSEEMLGLDDLVSDLGRDIEIGIRAVVEEAAAMLGPEYHDIPATAADALDFLEETAAEADNEVYVVANSCDGNRT